MALIRWALFISHIFKSSRHRPLPDCESSLLSYPVKPWLSCIYSTWFPVPHCLPNSQTCADCIFYNESQSCFFYLLFLSILFTPDYTKSIHFVPAKEREITFASGICQKFRRIVFSMLWQINLSWSVPVFLFALLSKIECMFVFFLLYFLLPVITSPILSIFQNACISDCYFDNILIKLR